MRELSGRPRSVPGLCFRSEDDMPVHILLTSLLDEC